MINGLKREELIASNSMILPELYFDGLGSEGETDKDLRSALVRDFGSLERGQTQFTAMGKVLGGGSGCTSIPATSIMAPKQQRTWMPPPPALFPTACGLDRIVLPCYIEFR